MDIMGLPVLDSNSLWVLVKCVEPFDTPKSVNIMQLSACLKEVLRPINGDP